MDGLVVRVVDARLVPDGGPGRFVVTGLPDVAAVAERAASAGGNVDVDDAGRLVALVTPTQLVNAAGRVDADTGRALEAVVEPAVAAWLAPVLDMALAEGQVLTGPAVMGIVNVTPDSFSDGGVAYDAGTHPDASLGHARALASAGAAVLDVGGESTRPGAAPVAVDDELARVVPVVAALADEGFAVSVDTVKAEVAHAAVAAGAVLVNDVSAGTRDPDLLATVADLGVGYVLMHAQGTPDTMQDDPRYDDVVAEVYEFLAAGLQRCRAAGIAPERITVDPGIGFGKTLEHNLALLRATRDFAGLGRPVLVGASRKTFIGTIAGVPAPEDRLAGSLAVAALAVADGAAMVRVHDVAATRQAVLVADAVRGTGVR